MTEPHAPPPPLPGAARSNVTLPAALQRLSVPGEIRSCLAASERVSVSGRWSTSAAAHAAGVGQPAVRSVVADQQRADDAGAVELPMGARDRGRGFGGAPRGGEPHRLAAHRFEADEATQAAALDDLGVAQDAGLDARLHAALESLSQVVNFSALHSADGSLALVLRYS